MPVPGLPTNILSAAEFAAWRKRNGKSWTGDSFRNDYWQYRANAGYPVPGSTYSTQTPQVQRQTVTPPPIPDSVAALQQQRDLLYQQFNPQRQQIAAGTAATLEGQGYADSGTATVTARGATNPDGSPAGNDVRYLVFRGADGRLYRQAYVSVQNQGAQRGSLFTSGTGDEHALNRQRLDMARQGVIDQGDQQQTQSLANEAGQYQALSNQYQSGMDAWRQSASQAVQSAELPPPPAVPAKPVPAKPVVKKPAVRAAAPKPVKPVVKKPQKLYDVAKVWKP